MESYTRDLTIKAQYIRVSQRPLALFIYIFYVISAKTENDK